MARTTRFRTRTRGAYAGSRTGTWQNVPRDETQFASLAYSESCQDSHGRPVVASALSLSRTDKTRYKGYSYIRTNPSNPLERVEWKDYWFAYQYVGSIGHLSTSTPNPGALGATIRARTNPSRPIVAPLTIIQDAVELPKMLRDVGKLLRTPKSLLSPRELANHYLGAKFGWLPLIHDVKTLMGTQDYVMSRFREIHSLYDRGGLGRTIQLGRENVNQGFFESLESDLVSVFGTRSVGTSQRVWGSVRWKPTTLPGYTPSDARMLRAAQAAVSGFTPDGLLKGAWDLLPWSWMVDWWSNTGDWLTQNSVFIPAAPTDTCVMRERNTVVQHLVSSAPPGFKNHGGVGLLSSKERTVTNGSLSVSLPMLDVNRLSVLGALFVQRFKR